MAAPENLPDCAWLESPAAGLVEFARDWVGAEPPPLQLRDHAHAVPFASFAAAPRHAAAERHGYFVSEEGAMGFVLRRGAVEPDTAVFVAGDFNGWAAAIGDPAWQLHPAVLGGREVLLCQAGAAAAFFSDPWKRFKFVTAEHQWLTVAPDAPNAARDESGNFNRFINPGRTGAHAFAFAVATPLDLAEPWMIAWGEAVAAAPAASVPLRPGRFFLNLHTELSLGALVCGGQTTFRLFAPRARGVRLVVTAELAALDRATPFPLARRRDADGAAGVWEITLSDDLHGWFYAYCLDGPRDASTHFDPAQRVLDPYALAAVGRDGPGIVIDRARLGRADTGGFRTPAWQDLVIAEAHVRDLAALAPGRATAAERLGFTGLTQWVQSEDFYLSALGVNCVELQPIQQNDARSAAEYHWGYMTTNYFAPDSGYALDSARASGLAEVRALVAAFHGRGIAVVLDVVYNHVGEPAHLLFIDRLYYFEQDAAGNLTNGSGCGNDLRAHAAMAQRLIIDSCTHLLEAFGVDGFRFDLAELLGADVLRAIEAALKRVKPDVILIAEPWSFRGHIAGALRDTGWASWNDGYRDFFREWVRGGGTAARFEYFLKGSPWYWAKWPAQTVNYTESHDDRAWIDNITEHADFDGTRPTAADRRRTHLMAACLFASIGIPMIAAGQDFLRSKGGVTNTYQRGDLNALDYRGLARHAGTHTYFAEWIAFRRSERGRLLRQFTRPGENFFQFFTLPGSTACAALYNADHSQGPARLLFAVNPTESDAQIHLGAAFAAAGGAWRQLANVERFFGDRGLALATDEDLFVPALGCSLWWSET